MKVTLWYINQVPPFSPLSVLVSQTFVFVFVHNLNLHVFIQKFEYCFPFTFGSERTTVSPVKATKFLLFNWHTMWVSHQIRNEQLNYSPKSIRKFKVSNFGMFVNLYYRFILHCAKFSRLCNNLIQLIKDRWCLLYDQKYLGSMLMRDKFRTTVNNMSFATHVIKIYGQYVHMNWV